MTLWFLAVYLVGQAKTGLSFLALMRQLGISYPTAWLVQQKLMQAMAESEASYALGCDVLVDDAYIGVERADKLGRDSENEIVVRRGGLAERRRASRLRQDGPAAGLHTQGFAAWAEAALSPGCVVFSGGLSCFASVADAGCVGPRPEHWLRLAEASC